jgi:arylamine N-acetyltransferase
VTAGIGGRMTETSLPDLLLDHVLERLEIARGTGASPEMLRTVYHAWCQRVPFDNVQKLVHVREGNPGPLPGTTAEEFLDAWLRHGTGGTCWASAGGLRALLAALGFEVERGVATMLVVPDLPPNHGTVRVRLNGEHYLLDSSILHGEPLRLWEGAESRVEHPAWGVSCGQRDGRWHVQWRPMHKTDGFECRIESFGAEHPEFAARYEETRDWSPFNYQAYARRNLGEEVKGLAFGNAVTLKADGSVVCVPVDDDERRHILVRDLGMSEEIAAALPADIPTPPPPGSKTAAHAAAN